MLYSQQGTVANWVQKKGTAEKKFGNRCLIYIFIYKTNIYEHF